MTRLTDALDSLGLAAEIALAGRWAQLQGEVCAVFVAEAPWGAGFYTWCDHPRERDVEYYVNPIAAIRAGLERASASRHRQPPDGGADAVDSEPKQVRGARPRTRGK
jgi:hypothetical protein